MKKYWEIIINYKDGSNEIVDAKDKRHANSLLKKIAKEDNGNFECLTIQANNGEEILDDTQVTYYGEKLQALKSK